MHTVELFGCTADVNSDELVALIRSYSDMSLQASIKEIDRLRAGGSIALVFNHLSEARTFALEAETLGAYVAGGV
jgi:hypothetical protein